MIEALAGEMSRAELMELLGLRDAENFRTSYLLLAIEQGLIEMTIPDKPRSRLQKYRLTPLGKQVLATKE